MSKRIEEILQVLELLRPATTNPISRKAIRRRRVAASKEVARQRGITSQTVRDKCRRQLQPHVSSAEEFDELVYLWLAGDSLPLVRALVDRSVDAEDQANIQEFFTRTN